MATDLALVKARATWLDVHASLGISLMDHLFNRLDGMYPNRWRAAFANDRAVQNWREAWAAAFAEEGLTPDQIAAGVRACRRLYDWPPSLPEFLKACAPVVRLDPEAAYREAAFNLAKRANGLTDDVWSTPAIYWAALEFGPFELRTTPYHAAAKRWTALLEIHQGKESPPVPPNAHALPAPGETAMRREEVEAAVAKAWSILRAPTSKREQGAA